MPKVLVTVSGSSPAVERFLDGLARASQVASDAAGKALLAAVGGRTWEREFVHIIINHRQAQEMAERVVAMAKKNGFAAEVSPATDRVMLPSNPLFASLSTEQYGALTRFVQGAGRNWRSTLRDAWSTGRYPVQSIKDSIILDGIRNRHGFAWLETVKAGNLGQQEDPGKAAYEQNRREQARIDAAHERAEKLGGTFIRAVQEAFESEDIGIEQYEAALFAAETGEARLRICLDGVPFLKGDAASIGVLYRNLTGANFMRETWQPHQEYLDSMEQHFGKLVGRTVALETMDGHQIAEHLIEVAPSTKKSKEMSSSLAP